MAFLGYSFMKPSAAFSAHTSIPADELPSSINGIFNLLGQQKYTAQKNLRHTLKILNKKINNVDIHTDKKWVMC